MRAQRPRSNEHAHQVALFSWASLMAQRGFADLDLMFAVPNAGKRSAVAGHRLKREGMKPGVPDVWLPVPRGEFRGLVFEMKDGTNDTTKEQDWWLMRMQQQGWRTSVCWGWDQARELVADYMGIPNRGMP